jgi:hypothetical protein
VTAIELPLVDTVLPNSALNAAAWSVSVPVDAQEPSSAWRDVPNSSSPDLPGSCPHPPLASNTDARAAPATDRKPRFLKSRIAILPGASAPCDRVL